MPLSAAVCCSLRRDFEEFVVFDLETTGFGPADRITEIGAVKLDHGETVDVFSRLVDPGRPIPWQVQRLTGITDEAVFGQPPIEAVLPEFLDFIGLLPLVAHNAPFDCGFLYREAANLGRAVPNTVVDTLRLARRCWPGLPTYRLTYLTDYFCISQTDAHRAWCDAEATAKLYRMMRKKGDDL